MTILGVFLNDEIRTGGHRRYLELAEGLARKGHRVVVVMNCRLPYDPLAFKALRIDVPYSKKSLIPRSFRFLKVVGQHLAYIRDVVGTIDFIMIHGETHFAAACLLKKTFGTRLLYGYRSNAVREAIIAMREKWRNPIALIGQIFDAVKYVCYERAISVKADIIAFQSSFDEKDFLSRAPGGRGKTVVIGGDIGEPRFHSKDADSNRSDRLTRIAFIGTLGSRKGVRYLLLALKSLHDRGYVDIECDIIGPGEKRQGYERQIAAWGMAKTVRFHGRVKDPFPMMASADLVVIPSLFDSYPDAVLEALHVGTPVIASSVGGIPDILVHEELLFPPMNARVIADRIATFIDDPAVYLHAKALCAERKKAFIFDWPGAWERAMLDNLA
jgi:glycosyltransferase involved in cell wall biosynthesis